MIVLDFNEISEQFDDIIARVEAGEVFGLTRNGRLIARVEPPLPIGGDEQPPTP